MTRNATALGLAITVAAGTANASVWSYEWSRPDSAISFTDDAGTATSFKTTYDDVAGRLTLEMTWSDLAADGMSIVLTNGEHPSEGGRYAILFLEPGPSAGHNPNELSVRANMLGYNGSADAKSSIFDGDASLDGDQAPDHIATTEYGLQNWYEDQLVADEGGERTLRFTINTDLINSYIPQNAGASAWSGFGYGENLGVWARTYSDVSTNYDIHGYLTQWNFSVEGNFDGTFIPTENITVPGPGAAALLAFACVGVTRRRR
ncbi:MAG: hypothetical protein DHS20C14_16220 [Phycisphaeraceae bacterium]|nr:MAG: hypothetical protein DHS20C14_16220 [Phycisphaeraceae bacterium]